jgi:hypothetical protein
VSAPASPGWIGVDLDGVLAHYEEWKGIEHIGEPIPKMLKIVKELLTEGKHVKIFTARVYCGESGEPEGDRFREAQEARKVIEKWCARHLGIIIPITCTKNLSMIDLWDDRCKQVVLNKGEFVSGS